LDGRTKAKTQALGIMMVPHTEFTATLLATMIGPDDVCTACRE
jgi:hypothetical protein